MNPDPNTAVIEATRQWLSNAITLPELKELATQAVSARPATRLLEPVHHLLLALTATDFSPIHVLAPAREVAALDAPEPDDTEDRTRLGTGVVAPEVTADDDGNLAATLTSPYSDQPPPVRYRVEQTRVAYLTVPRIGDSLDTLLAANVAAGTIPDHEWTVTGLDVALGPEDRARLFGNPLPAPAPPIDTSSIRRPPPALCRWCGEPVYRDHPTTRAVHANGERRCATEAPDGRRHNASPVPLPKIGDQRWDPLVSTVWQVTHVDPDPANHTITASADRGRSRTFTAAHWNTLKALPPSTD